MSITRLTKVTLFGSNAGQKAALNDLQRLGCVHLISMGEESRPVALTAPEWIESVAGALRHLIGCTATATSGDRSAECQYRGDRQSGPQKQGTAKGSGRSANLPAAPDQPAEPVGKFYAASPGSNQGDCRDFTFQRTELAVISARRLQQIARSRR
jgi:hypothetical protein